MTGVRFADVRLRPTEFLDFTSLTLEDFECLLPAFEAAFQAHMADWGVVRTWVTPASWLTAAGQMIPP
jgi:hypothetical protein